MKKSLLLILNLTSFTLAENFIIPKTKQTQSPNKLKEKIAIKLGEILKITAENVQYLGETQKKSLEKTYDLLNNKNYFFNLSKTKLSNYLSKLEKIKNELEKITNFLKINIVDL